MRHLFFILGLIIVPIMVIFLFTLIGVIIDPFKHRYKRERNRWL